MKKYVFKPYDSVYPKLSEAEKNRIRKVLGSNDLIEHIGSTSVPGLGGKEVKKYIEIKKMAVKKAAETREVYIKIKSPFIEEITRKALMS